MTPIQTVRSSDEPTVQTPQGLNHHDPIPCEFLRVDQNGTILYSSPSAQHFLSNMDDGGTKIPACLQELVSNCTANPQRDYYPVQASTRINDQCWCESIVIPDHSGPSARFILYVRSLETDRQVYADLQARLQQLTLITEMTAALNSTSGLDEVFNVILVGVTAEEGLRFNRAFLFLDDDDNDNEWLRGRVAIGPVHPDEAGSIWNAVAQLGTRGLLNAIKTYRMEVDGHDAAINKLVGETRIPRHGPDNPFAESIEQQRAMVIPFSDSDAEGTRTVFRVLDSPLFACAPLCAHDRVVGLLLADNRITGRDIDADSLRALELLAVHAGAAVERARLADALERQIQELRRAHHKIAGIQGTMAELERLSVVGEVTNEVAHQLRNPLTIIGGFARSLLAGREQSDDDHHALEIISRQTDRITNMLERLISTDRGDMQDTHVFEVAPIIRQAIEVVSVRFVTRDIAYTLRFDNESQHMAGQPDGLRFALCELISAIVRHIPDQPQLHVRVESQTGMIRVIISLFEADTLEKTLEAAHARVLSGDWGVSDERRNLALGYFAEQGGGFGLESTEHGKSIVIEFSDNLEADS